MKAASRVATVLLVAAVIALPAAAFAVGGEPNGGGPRGRLAVPSQVMGEPFARTELYFGTDKPGPDVSNAQFRRFVEEQVTPRFPDGLTILEGIGQFREEDQDIVREDSKVIVLLYPLGTVDESSQKIEEIRSLYEEQFQQQSVLRVDSEEHVSF